MNTITTRDGVDIFYKDWGPKDAQPIMFHHGWPLSSDDWDAQMLFFLARGYRVVAHDRRGHGRSSQVGDGHICIPLCLGLFALIKPLPVPAFFELSMMILLGVTAAHFLFVSAFGRLAWNHEQTSQAIAEDWTRMTWGNSAEVVAAIVDASEGTRPTTIDDATCERYFGCPLDGLPTTARRIVAAMAAGGGPP